MSVEGFVDAPPLDDEQRQHLQAHAREAVEALVALGFFAPLADEQALCFQPAEQRIERALVDDEAVFGEEFAQRVSVLFRAKRREDGDRQAAPPDLEPEVVEDAVSIGCLVPYTVCHTLYVT